MNEGFWALVVIALVSLTIWYAHAPAPSIVGDHAVPTRKASFQLWGSADAADGTYRVLDDGGHAVVAFHVRDNRVSIVPSEPVVGSDGQPHTYTSDYEPFYYFGRNVLDLGTWAGYANFSGADDRHFQTGLRYSPYRFLYGIASTDLVVSQQAVGAGLSLYPPADRFGNIWHHFGLGAWYLVPFSGSHPAVAYGASFTTF